CRRILRRRRSMERSSGVIQTIYPALSPVIRKLATSCFRSMWCHHCNVPSNDHLAHWNTLPDPAKHPAQIATSNYAGSIGSQKMESWNSFKLSTVVGNGGAKYDADDDGEDWFNQNPNPNYPCQTGAASGGTNIRADCPDAKTISGVF